jgi:hypothetical protein
MTKTKMEIEKIVEIIEGITGNALPWKIIENKNKQLPEDMEWHEIGNFLEINKKFDLVIAKNINDILLAGDILKEHGKIYFFCETKELKKVLSVAHNNELFWAECRSEKNFSHLILRKRRNFTQPRWNGEKGDILLHCDWGWGDNIQFLRYCELAKQQCKGKLILEVRLGLEDLCKTLKGVDQIIVKGNDLPKFDYHAEIADMERLFLKIPSPPYLFPERPKKHKSFNVGCVWHGHHLTFNFFRFYNPNLIKKLQLPGVKFFSFQKKTDERFELTPDFMEDLSPKIFNWNDTANFLSEMDLLISVDTSICHLSGAIGLNTWVILPKKTYNTPISKATERWYPKTKIFINKEEENWNNLFEEIKKELKKELLKRLL